MSGKRGCTWRCDDCGRIFTNLEQMRGSGEIGEPGGVFPDIPFLAERLEPGGTVPDGECPSCGALVYAVGSDEGLEINRELVVSSAHIREEDADILHARASSGVASGWPSTVDNVAWGWRVWVQREDSADDAVFHGMSAEFLVLLNLAREHGCKWLIIDSDGPEVRGYPRFEW